VREPPPALTSTPPTPERTIFPFARTFSWNGWPHVRNSALSLWPLGHGGRAHPPPALRAKPRPLREGSAAGGARRGQSAAALNAELRPGWVILLGVQAPHAGVPCEPRRHGSLRPCAGSDQAKRASHINIYPLSYRVPIPWSSSAKFRAPLLVVPLMAAGTVSAGSPYPAPSVEPRGARHFLRRSQSAADRTAPLAFPPQAERILPCT